MRENIDSHYLLDAHDNGMAYGRRTFNGVQHQPIHTGFPNSSSLAHRFSVALPNARHNAIGIPLLPLSNHLIQAPTPSLEIATNDPQSNHDIVRSEAKRLRISPSAISSTTYARDERKLHRLSSSTYTSNKSFKHISPSAVSSTGCARDERTLCRLSSCTYTSNKSFKHFFGARDNSSTLWRNLPPQAFLQDDDVPWLGDDDSDMHLDIDDMSYEELLELGERIGNVGTSLLDETIARQMKTKTYLLPNNSREVAAEEQENDLCIICRDEYKNKQEIGILQCGHGYHTDCIRTWLHEKNVCPLCKSEALTLG
ncbi:hypothetical protein ACSQ67_023797 [Phaseolus vulgaris]